MVVILTATFLLALIPFSQVYRLTSRKSYGGISPGQDAEERDLSMFPISPMQTGRQTHSWKHMLILISS